MKARPPGNPRVAAVATLTDVFDRGRNLPESSPLPEAVDSRDAAFARHLAYGALRWWTAIDWLARQLLSKPLKARDQDIYRLIALGIYQLWQDEAPPHAVVHETAECARLLQKPWAVGVINAVLRRFQRESAEWLGKLASQPEAAAHPPWLLQRLQQDWPEAWPAIAAANNQQAPLWLRHNRRSRPLIEVIERLEDQGFEVSRHPHAPDALRLEPAAAVQALPGFASGEFSVQDPAAQLAVEMLDLAGPLRVLDACAAPGGKTCHILERHPQARLTALDISPHRCELTRQNLERLKLDCRLITGDVLQPSGWWDGVAFQRILLDAPCSSTGVIRRHPEIKHLRQPGQVQDAARLQGRLLLSLWPLLEPGGILVYATCSVFKDENSRQIGEFLQRQADASEERPDVAWGRPQPHGRQILPGEEGMDGFFYARLRKAR